VPEGFHTQREVVRAPTSRRHCRVARVCGTATVAKAKRRPAATKPAGGLYWLTLVDPDTLEHLTDGPVSTRLVPPPPQP